MSPQPRAVIFDLDGTLADTAALAGGRRTPAHVLERCRPGEVAAIDFGHGVADLPGRLIAAGYRVAITTRAPDPYARTVFGLLGLDYHVHCHHSMPESSVAEAAESLDVPCTQTLYVGDRVADELAAIALGAEYLQAPWITGGRVVDLLSRVPLDAGFRANDPRPRATPDRRSLTQRSSCPPWIGALATLMDYPGYRDRRNFQQVFLNAVPREARACVMPVDGRIFYPELVTHAERRMDGALNVAVLRSVGRLFPPVRTAELCAVPTFVFVAYGSRWGRMIGLAKDWRFNHSGPEVQIALLELPATAMAAALLTLGGDSSLVPVPPSPFSPSRPGEASRRLAYRVAAMARRRVLDVLAKEDDAIETNQVGRRERVVVIEDQAAEGTNLNRSVTALQQAGFHVDLALSWSTSQRSPDLDVDDPCYLEAWEGTAYGTHLVWCPGHG